MTRWPIMPDHDLSALVFILDLTKALLHAAPAGDDADQHLRVRRLDLMAGPSEHIPSEQAAAESASSDTCCGALTDKAAGSCSAQLEFMEQPQAQQAGQ